MNVPHFILLWFSSFDHMTSIVINMIVLLFVHVSDFAFKTESYNGNYSVKRHKSSEVLTVDGTYLSPFTFNTWII